MAESPVRVESGFKRVIANPWVHIAIVVLVGLLAYSNSFDAPFYFDDQAFLENPQVRSLNNLPEIFARPEGKFASRPLMHATFALNFAIGSADSSERHMDTTGFHVVNVALHLLNGALLYILVIMMAKIIAAERRKSGYMALFISAVFVLHPVQTEAVTYLVSRSMLLATTFYLLGIILFIKSLTADRRRAVYIICLFAASIAGMGSREDFATFPFMLVLFDLVFISKFRPKDVIRHYSAYIPVFMSLGYMYFLVTAGHNYDTLTEMPDSGLPHGEYAITQFKVQWTYIRLLLLPVNQNLDYYYPTAKTLLESRTLFPFIGYLGLWFVGIIFAKKRPATSFGMLWFLITLIPISFGVVFLNLRLDDVMFEHRLYLPSIGLIAALGIGCFALLEKLDVKWTRNAFVSTLVLIIAVIWSATYSRNALWSDHVAMWEDVVHKSPKKARPHNNLGNAYDMRGLTERAEAQFKQAIALDPFYADPHFNLGSIYYKRGMYREAAEHFNYTVYAKPDFAEAHLNLALSLEALGDRKKAEKHLKIAASIRPYAEAHFNLGVMYMKEEDFGKAGLEFRKALAINPWHTDSRRFLEYVSKPGGGPPH